MSDASPRQVLYALVSGAFVLVVLSLVVGAAVAGLVPVWWTAVMALSAAGVGVWMLLNWRRTIVALTASILLFIVWMIGTLIVA